MFFFFSRLTCSFPRVEQRDGTLVRVGRHRQLSTSQQSPSPHEVLQPRSEASPAPVFPPPPTFSYHPKDSNFLIKHFVPKFDAPVSRSLVNSSSSDPRFELNSFPSFLRARPTIALSAFVNEVSIDNSLPRVIVDSSKLEKRGFSFTLIVLNYFLFFLSALSDLSLFYCMI